MILSLLTCFSIFVVGKSLILGSPVRELNTIKLHLRVLNLARATSKLSSVAIYASSKDDDIIIPPIGKGEWADWDSDSFVEEPYEADEEEIEEAEDAVVLSKEFDSVKLVPTESGQWSPLSTGKSQGMSAADNWPGWSEEAPYFDEDDTQDDEGNWGRAEGTDRPGYGAVSGSSDLWTRQTPAEEPGNFKKVPVAAAPTVAPPASTSSHSSISQSIPTSDALILVLEMNRQFAAMEAKMTQAQINSDRRIDKLTDDIRELKELLILMLRK